MSEMLYVDRFAIEGDHAKKVHDAGTDIEKLTEAVNEKQDYRNGLSNEDKLEFDKEYIQADKELTQREFNKAKH